MKTIIVVLLSFSAFLVNAQMQNFKVTPKTFTDEVGIERTIIAIQARIESGIDINLSDSTFLRKFYVAFELETGTIYGARTTTTDEFITRSVDNGIAEATAILNIKNICRLLEYGTKQEKYTAAKDLALIYGYVLKPINQQ